jgi:hypothetical protein
MKYFAELGVFVLILVLISYVQIEDSKQIEQEQALYCSNVKYGVWPDYEKSYKEFCQKEFGEIEKVFSKKLDEVN